MEIVNWTERFPGSSRSLLNPDLPSSSKRTLVRVHTWSHSRVFGGCPSELYPQEGAKAESDQHKRRDDHHPPPHGISAATSLRAGVSPFPPREARAAMLSALVVQRDFGLGRHHGVVCAVNPALSVCLSREKQTRRNENKRKHEKWEFHFSDNACCECRGLGIDEYVRVRTQKSPGRRTMRAAIKYFKAGNLSGWRKRLLR